MSASLEGKVVLITGGTGSLGKAITRRFLDAGAHCTVTYRKAGRTSATYAELAAELGTPAKLSGVEVELTDAAAVSRCVDGVVEKHGRIDRVVAAAGGFHFAFWGDTDAAVADRMLQMNYWTFFHTAKAAWPHMQKQGSGALVSIASRAGHEGAAGMSAYAASKAALLNLCDTLCAEGRRNGISVYSILPTIIDTPQNRAAMAEEDFSKWVQPETIAEGAAYLCAQEHTELSGTRLKVYGDV